MFLLADFDSRIMGQICLYQTRQIPPREKVGETCVWSFLVHYGSLLVLQKKQLCRTDPRFDGEIFEKVVLLHNDGCFVGMMEYLIDGIFKKRETSRKVFSSYPRIFDRPFKSRFRAAGEEPGNVNQDLGVAALLQALVAGAPEVASLSEIQAQITKPPPSIKKSRTDSWIN